MKPRPSRRIPLLKILVALCATATACGSADIQPTADLLADTSRSVPSTSGPAPSDGPQYGDSMEDWIDGSGAEAVEPGPSADSTEFAEIQWEELTPPGFSGDEVYDRYADRLAAVDDYSEEADAIYAEMQAEFEDAPVNAELDGKKIRLAGFVTPFNFDDELITEFLLVPYFGACIHVPPPPSNQTILVTLDEGQGMPFNDAWGAVWVTGTLSATSTDTGLATAGYSISGAQSGVYDES